ncbi:MAG: hypothetical protein CM15mP67_09780 [Alphaproteobacteria bacterium]|nr:MAG: hypothetical protein CM15mP67_09780 [Alphaproteobacteria bacterium]
MLHPFFIFLLSFTFFNLDLENLLGKKSHASSILILPEKRPHITNDYNYSLGTINDMILKEGGKTIGKILKQKIKKNENLHLFLKRVGFENKQINAITSKIKSDHPSINILRNIPTNHLIHYAIPKNNLGFGINFKIGKYKDLYVWQNNSSEIKTQITKRPFKKITLLNKIEITDNLYNSAVRGKLPKEIFSELIKTLGFSIDFQRELRKGDVFETLYSQKIDLITNEIIESNPIHYISASLKDNNLKFYRFTTKNGKSNFYDQDGKSSKKTLMKTPLNGARLSSGFGNRKHPILGFTKMHRGIDFAAPIGTPIFAAGDGVIEYSGWNGAYGKYIRIKHNGTFKTAYAHLSKIYKKRGTRIKQGDIIGTLGSTGRSTGPHLHYEILISGRQVNPLRIKLPSGKHIPKNELENFYKKQEVINSKIFAMRNKIKNNEFAYLKNLNNN